MKPVSDSAIEYMVKKFHMDKDFGKTFDRVDAACLVYMLRHDWESLHRSMIHNNLNYQFLTVAAFRFLDYGDFSVFEHVINLIPDDEIIKTEQKFQDHRFVRFSNDERTVRFEDVKN